MVVRPRAAAYATIDQPSTFLFDQVVALAVGRSL